MKVLRLAAVMGIAITTFTFSGKAIRATRLPRIDLASIDMPRVELLREARVTSAEVRLSDLFPASAPEQLRMLAEKIPLGAAPIGGNIRIFERDAVKRSASVNQDVLSRIVVPDRMAVSRDTRAITVSEVYDAICAALRKSEMPAAATLQPGDILLESHVFVASGDSGLRVIRMDMDRGLGRARFLLWASRDPKVLPFFATANLGEEADAALLRPKSASVRFSADHSFQAAVATASRVRTLQPPAREILVSQGQHATLALHSGAVRIVLDVVSLDRGARGDHVRVRTFDSAKVIHALVDGPGHLEVEF